MGEERRERRGVRERGVVGERRERWERRGVREGRGEVGEEGSERRERRGV